MASHAQDLKALWGMRRVASVPRDQQKLLDRDNVWAVDVASRPQGLVNVPDHVLETITAAYTAKQQQPTSIGTSTRPAVQEDAHQQNGVEAAEQGPNTPRATSPETDMSWEETPPRPASQHRPLQKSPSPESAISGEETPPKPAQQHNPPQESSSKNNTARIASKSSPLPPRTTSTQLRNIPKTSPRVNNSPSVQQPTCQDEVARPPRSPPVLQLVPQFSMASSDNEDDDVPEVLRTQSLQKPGFIPNHAGASQASSAGPNALHGQALNTPPCAQPSQTVIPETVLKAISPAKQAPERRRNIIRMHALPSSPPRLKSRPRLAPSYIPGQSSNSTDSSAPTSTMSVSGQLTQNMAEARPSKRIKPAQAFPKASASKAQPKNASIPDGSISSVDARSTTNNNQASGSVQKELVVTEPSHEPVAAEPSISKPAVESASRQSLGLKRRSSSTKPHLPEPRAESHEQQQAIGRNVQLKNSASGTNPVRADSSTPFDEFVQIYPNYTESYSGNLDRFVTACVCLEYLQNERGLKEFLYDDFIRAFSSGFLPYVRKAGPGQEALPAVQWYNMQSGRPLFTNMFVHKMNLDKILKAYPEHVAGSRAVVAASDESKDATPTTTNAAPSVVDAMEIDDEIQESPQQSPEPVPALVPAPEPVAVPATDPVPVASPSRPSPSLSTPASPECEVIPKAPPPPSAATAAPVATPAGTVGGRRSSRYMERLTSSKRPSSKKRKVDRSTRIKEHFIQHLSSSSRPETPAGYES